MTVLVWVHDYWYIFLIAGLVGLLALGLAGLPIVPTAGGGGGGAGTAPAWLSYVSVVSLVVSVAGFLYAPHYYRLLPSRDRLLVGETAMVVGNLVQYKDGSSSTNVGSSCDWGFDPPLPVFAHQDNDVTSCSTKITNQSSIFGNRTGNSLTLQVSTKTLQSWLPWQSAVPASLTLYNMNRPVIEGQNLLGMTRGSSQPVAVSFDGRGPANPRCSWDPADYVKPPDQCSTKVVVPSIPRDRKIDLRVTVDVERYSHTSEPVSVEFLLPPPRFYQIILDVSERMLRPVSSSASLFAVDRDEISARAKSFDVNGGWFSVIGFGDGAAPPNATACADKVAKVYPLAAVQPDAIDAALQPLNPRGRDAPLISAIDASLGEYKQFRDSYAEKSDDRTYVFAIFSNGGDSCRRRNLADVLKYIAQAFDSNEARAVYYDPRTLSFVVALESADIQNLISDNWYREHPTAVLVVRDQVELTEVIEAIFGISDPSKRRSACQRIREFLQRTGDEYHQRIIDRSAACRART